MRRRQHFDEPDVVALVGDGCRHWPFPWIVRWRRIDSDSPGAGLPCRAVAGDGGRHVAGDSGGELSGVLEAAPPEIGD